MLLDWLTEFALLAQFAAQTAVSPFSYVQAVVQIEEVSATDLRPFEPDELALSTNRASDQGPGSSTARIAARISSLAVAFLVLTGSTHCSSAVTKTNSSSSSRR
jgi:hypothetical protein